MIKIEHPYNGKIRMTKEERELSEKIKKAARYKIPALMQWYLEQLGETIEESQKLKVARS